jgi:hypothetical protein
MKTFMKSYYVRIKPQLNGTYAVHREDCPFLPSKENRIYLGKYSSCFEALKHAKMYFREATGCYFCTTQTLMTKNKIITNWPKKMCGLNSFDHIDCN